MAQRRHSHHPPVSRPGQSSLPPVPSFSQVQPPANLNGVSPYYFAAVPQQGDDRIGIYGFNGSGNLYKLDADGRVTQQTSDIGQSALNYFEVRPRAGALMWMIAANDDAANTPDIVAFNQTSLALERDWT